MKLLSVTQALNPFADFSNIPPHRLAFASERGSAVHAACAAYARRFPVLINDDFEGYFVSFKNWFDRFVRRPLFVESEFSDPKTYGIVGHPDIVAELSDHRITVIDYKTPISESRLWRSQIAAYCHLVEPVIGSRPAGMALMLDPNGGPARAKHYSYQPNDFAAFVAALTAYRYFKEA